MKQDYKQVIRTVQSMATVTCKYHVQTPARWACAHCQINFCVDCVAKPKQAGKSPHCPVCDKDLTSLGAGNVVVPFWYRLGKMFLYPAYLAPLILLLVITGSFYLFAFFPFPVGPLLDVVLFVVFFKYAYVALEDTAHGHMTPRELSSDALTDNMVLPFKQFVLMAALGGVNFTIYDMFGSVMGWLTYFLIIFAIPACTMVLAMEHSFFKAFNPLLVFTVIRRIGLSYLLMFGLINLISGAAGTLAGMLQESISPKIAALIYTFAGMYFTLIVFHLMGYLLYQYHEELGYSVEIETDVHAATNQGAYVGPELRAVEILIAEGKTQEAAQRLSQIIADTPGDLEARDRMLKLARIMSDNALHARQGQDYISYLFHENKVGMATKIYQDCVAFDKQFRPARPTERVEIAKMLKANSQAKAAVAILGNLHTEFPSFDGIPTAYLMVAKLVCEQFADDQKARQILQFLQKYYPNHATAAEVQEYLAVVEKLAAVKK